ncbi:MAG TPA: protein kinase [Terriglobales bacterium]|nr:protein kinase [Terriglobales bacterium]
MRLIDPGKHDRSPARYLVCFHRFEVNLQSGELFKNGQKIKLPEQSFQILAMLLERPQEVVMRAEIRKRLWPNDTAVEFENSIHAAVRRLRLALEDAAERPRFIETLARRGYRWMLPVEAMDFRPQNSVLLTAESMTTEAKLPAGNLIGKKVSHYRVLQALGGGGMGVVYSAEDLKLGRRVALKFLPEELADDPTAIERFDREARTASALNHPNICTIYAVEEHQGQPFIAMELLDGQTLREAISAAEANGTCGNGRNGRMPIEKLLDIALQTLQGLDAAHRKGIIHRDIKPANIFISTSGQVKILDFGLAKLNESKGVKREEPEQSDLRSRTGAENVFHANPNLTRTGDTMGTAGYMSPEQVRGEELDIRTDLFSFGLVLYEMAVGQRAFTGETRPALHEAILQQAPAPVRELNPRVPAKLEPIIAKAIEKNRGARYQTAERIRTDLESLRRDLKPRHWMRWWAACSTVVVVLAVITVFWRAKPQPPVPAAEIKLRQLTANSVENHVVSAAISHDGRLLAYSDIKGLHIKHIETGELEHVSQPPALNGQELEWEPVFWLADDRTLVANAHPSGIGPDWYSLRSSIWAFPLLGGAARKLRGDAVAYAISSDGSQISFGTNKGRLGDREMWLMGPTGEHARKLFETDDNHGIGGNDWSPHGRRILYPDIDAAGHTLISRDIETGIVNTVLTRSQTQGVNQHWWLADGRLIYAKNEEQAIGNISNLWTMRLDERTGEPLQKPRQLTNWTGFETASITGTKDGKRLAFLQSAFHASVYVADLEADGERIRNPTHFTLTESVDLLADWTQDSKAIIFFSNRTGRVGIYKQSLEDDTPELLVTERSGIMHPCSTPDGKWVLYLLNTNPRKARQPQLARVPTTGGSSEQMFPVRPGSWPLCARPPANVCAIAEPSGDLKEVIVTALDPLRGRGPELMRFKVEPSVNWAVDLTPDGNRIAVLTNPAGPIQIVSLRGQPVRIIHPKGLTNIQFLHWAENGHGVYVSTGARSGRALWHVDLQGNVDLLWETRGGDWAAGLPSPDGRHMAIQSSDDSSNVWMMENF